MPMSLRVWLLLAGAALAGACKDRGSSDQSSRPLPSPEPPASAAAPAAHEDAAPKKRSVDERDTAARSKHAAEEPAPATSAPPAPTAAPSAETAPSAAAPVASAPSATAPSAACLSRCQNALQGCLAQPVDGGVPGFSNVEVCKKALDACQSACAN
jgi:hypothetical protein